MAATLNQDDIKLLKSVFATKDDLDAKVDSLEAKINVKFDDLDVALIKYSKDIEPRISKLEDVIGISAAN